MECYCYLRNVQDLLADEKTPNEIRFGEPFKGPMVPLEQWLNIIRLHLKIRREFINLARMYCLEFLLAMSQSRGEFGREIS